ASHGSSPSANSPLRIDHAPSSFFAQNGPPGCAIRTSTAPSRTRYGSSPALRFNLLLACAAFHCSSRARHASHADGAFQVLQRVLEMTQQVLQVRNAAPAPDESEVEVVGGVG